MIDRTMTADATAVRPQPSPEPGVRMDRLYRRWKAARARRGRSPALDPVSTAWLVGLVSMLPLIPLDSALLGYTPDGANAIFRVLDGWSVMLIVVVSIALQARSIDRGLSALTPEPWTVRRRARRLRLLLAALPLAGLYVVPLWDELVRRRPSWAIDKDRDRPPYQPFGIRPPRPGRRARIHEVRPRWFRFLWSQLGLFLLGLLATFAWAQWLWHSATPSRQIQIVAGSVAFHGLGFGSMAYAFWQHARRSSTSSMSRHALPLLSLFWLVPLPFFGMLGLILMIFASSDRQEALASKAFTAAGRSPRWSAFLEDLRSVREEETWWKRLSPGRAEPEDTPKATESTAKLYLFARLKCLSLLFEGALLTLGISWLGRNWPELEVFLGSLLLIALIVAFAVGCVAVIMTFIHFVRRLLQDRDRRPPYARYIALCSLTFVASVLLGGFMERQQGQAAGGVLLVYGGTGLVLVGLRPLLELVLPLPREDPTRGHQVVGWTLGYFSIVVLGLGQSNPAMGHEGIELVPLHLLGLAFAGSILGLSLSGWVLRPRKLEQLIDEDTPLWTRAEIVFLTLTAILPLGGLVVPLWLYLRREWLEE